MIKQEFIPFQFDFWPFPGLVGKLPMGVGLWANCQWAWACGQIANVPEAKPGIPKRWREMFYKRHVRGPVGQVPEMQEIRKFTQEKIYLTHS